MAQVKVKNKQSFKWGGIFKGVLIGLCISLVLTLGLALITTLIEISDSVVSIITMVIKQASVVIAGFFAVKENRLGWLTGLFTGLIFAVVAFVIFSTIDGQFIFDKKFGMDVLFSAVFGTLSGIIAVNIKK